MEVQQLLRYRGNRKTNRQSKKHSDNVENSTVVTTANRSNWSCQINAL